jgi:murein DD-endopeptidase MepM/ murein hydrolase activator NlpD
MSERASVLASALASAPGVSRLFVVVVTTIAIGAAVGYVASAGAAPGAPRAVGALDRELEVARRTEVQVAEKLAARETDVAGRVRALYKLTRAGLAPLWLDGAARGELVRRRAAARRLIVRDLAERGLLRAELERARAARVRLEAELEARIAAEPAPLAPGVVVWPIQGAVLGRFGISADPSSGVRLSRTMVELGVRAGAPVVAPAAGTVRYAGPVRGLGQAVLIEIDPGVVVVVAGLAGLEVEAGAPIARGARLGAAHARVAVGLYNHGRAIDPLPLLAPSAGRR